MQNFEIIARSLVEQGGACQVQNEEELEKALIDILSDKEQARRMGVNAQAVVRENLGAIERTIHMILDKLDQVDTYKAQ
jgi:3-deoxy-D-manno-octulosonic-acid transferase